MVRRKEQNVAFAVYYKKENIYSFNALVGAIETVDFLSDVKIYFLREASKLNQQLNKILSKHDVVILGISFFTTQIWKTLDLLRQLSKIREKYDYKRLIIIAGGAHPSGDPLGTLKMGFDLVVVGEGEECIIEILDKVKNSGDLHSIKGIAYLSEDSKYVFTGKREPIDLNDYQPLPVINTRFGAIEITRGCPYMCYFCQTSFLFGSKPRHRSIESIVNVLKFMKHYDKTDIRFITPNAFSYGSNDGKELNLSKLEELLSKTNEIIQPNGRIFYGSFPSEVRPEHVNTHSLKLVNNYASNDNLVIGAQSGSNKVLSACNRGHTIEEVYDAVRFTLDAGLKANVDFIFGLPNETEQDIKLSLAAMKYLSSIGAKIHAHTFMPLPNTPFSRIPIKELSKTFKKKIKALNSKGLLYGDWKKQEILAVKISQYLKENKI